MENKLWRECLHQNMFITNDSTAVMANWTARKHGHDPGWQRCHSQQTWHQQPCCRFLLCNIRRILPFLTREANHITRQEYQYWTMDWTIIGYTFIQYECPASPKCFSQSDIQFLHTTPIYLLPAAAYMHFKTRCKPVGQWRALLLLPPSHCQSLHSGGTLVT